LVESFYEDTGKGKNLAALVAGADAVTDSPEEPAIPEGGNATTAGDLGYFLRPATVFGPPRPIEDSISGS